MAFGNYGDWEDSTDLGIDEKIVDNALEQKKKFYDKNSELLENALKGDEQAIEKFLKLTDNKYKKSSLARKKQMVDDQIEGIKHITEAFEEQVEEQKKLIKEREIDEQKAIEKISKLEENAAKSRSKFEEKYNEQLKRSRMMETALQRATPGKGGLTITTKSGKTRTLKSPTQFSEDSQEKIDKLNDTIQNLYYESEKAKASGDKSKAWEVEKEIAKQEAKRNAEEIKKAVVEGVTKSMNTAFKEAETILTTYKSTIDARLQGSERNYKDMMNTITTNLSINPYVQTQEVVKKMKEAVDKGIAYNVEQRAFLDTVSEKIANTFDAFDSNLMRLVRLQQADSTAARLGMEASLTKFFNNMFEDTTYLEDLSDAVSGALIDASSQLNKEQSAEFEYIVQKWLGSLYSLGMSQGSLTTIAQGLNYLGTGDVKSLASNTPLQTLFAMSAANAGLEYSDLLLNGLNASNTNKLLESMVKYLKDIAENSDNQVVRAAYGDVFNMSLSDMKAISNLTASDITNISANALSYAGMNSELSNQFGQLSKRLSLPEMVSNLYNNAVFGVASDLVNNPITYAMWKMLDFMDQNNIDMNIPFVSAMGTGVDINASVQDIMRLGLGVAGTASLVGNIFKGLSGAGFSGGNLGAAWNATETTKRGSGMTFAKGTVLGETSGSTYFSNASSSDMRNSALNTATSDAEETSKITNKNNKAEYTFDDFYNAVIGEKAESFVTTHDSLLAQVFNTTDNYLSTYNSSLEGLISYAGELQESKNSIPIKTLEDEEISIRINSIAPGVELGNSVVSLAPGSTVKIDKQTLVSAFKEALGYDKKDEQVKNVGDLMEALADGSIVVKIGNESGKRLQVDTEWTGTSGYASAINW